MNSIAQIDISILNYIYDNFRSGAGDVIFKLITHLGDAGILWILLGLLFLVSKKTRKTGLCVAAALIIGVLVGNVLMKNLIGRARPFTLEEARQTADALLIARPSDFSFPSGHTLASFGAATAIFANRRSWGIFAYITAALIAFSRLYLYVHFPTDILGGIIVGAGSGILAVFIVNKLLLYLEKRREPAAGD